MPTTAIDLSLPRVPPASKPVRTSLRARVGKLTRQFMMASLLGGAATCLHSDTIVDSPPTRFETLAAATCPPLSQQNSQAAYIVFTGGEGRVPTGLYLYTHSQNPNSFLYISGVDRDVKLSNVLRANSHGYLVPEINRSIFNDHAGSTNANAIQTAMFLKEHCISNVTFITSDYHMERARYVLQLALNDIHYSPTMTYVSVEAPPLSFREQLQEDVKTSAVRFFHALGIL